MNMDLVASALFFVLVLMVVLWRERRRWKSYSAAREKMEAEVPKLVQTVSRRYEQKYGREPSALQGMLPISKQ